MCGGFTGEHEEMRKTSVTINNNGDFQVNLFKDDVKIGFIDLAGKSKYYAEDVEKNWAIGILKEDNEYIIRTSSSLTNNSE